MRLLRPVRVPMRDGVRLPPSTRGVLETRIELTVRFGDTIAAQRTWTQTDPERSGDVHLRRAPANPVGPLD